MEVFKINEGDVRYCITKLGSYDDTYSRGIVEVFEHYLLHADFDQMRHELECVPQDNIAFHNRWDLDLRMGFLDVIYPE